MRAGAAPWRKLALLGAAVLAAHLAILGGVPVSLGSHAQVQATAPFITRTIAAPTPAVAQPSAAPKPAPRPTSQVRPRPAARAPQAAAPVASAAPIHDDGALAATTQAPAAVVAAAPERLVSEVAPAPAEASQALPPPQATEPVTPVRAVALPASVRLKYMVSGQQGVQPMSGVAADLLWLNDGERYEARLAFTFLFRTLRAQVSTGRIGEQGLAPERFGDRRRSEVAVHFERDKGRITFSANTPDAPLLPGAQDRVSVFFQLAGLLAAQPGGTPAAGRSYAIQTAGPRDAVVWTFTVGEPARLRLPIGELDTVQLVREPRNPYDQKVEIWFAPSLGWLPVRLRIADANGDIADQQLRATEAP